MNCFQPGRFNAPVSPATSAVPASSYLVLTVRFKMQHRHQPFSLTRLFTRVHHLNWRSGELQLPTKKQRKTASGFVTVSEPSTLPVRHEREVAAPKYCKCCTLTALASARWCWMTICQQGNCHTGLVSTYRSNMRRNKSGWCITVGIVRTTFFCKRFDIAGGLVLFLRGPKINWWLDNGVARKAGSECKTSKCGKLIIINIHIYFIFI